MDDILREKIENQFIERCKANNIKCDTTKFKKAQAEFFAGAMSALIHSKIIESVDVKWTMTILSGRSIVNYTL